MDGTISTGQMIFELVLAVIGIAALWKVFTKAGEAGWKSIIPFYNTFIQFKISWNTKMFWIWFICGMLTAIFGAILSDVTGGAVSIILLILTIVFGIIDLVLYIKEMHYLSKSFDHGAGFTVGLVFLNLIFLLILGFGSSQYVGNGSEMQ